MSLYCGITKNRTRRVHEHNNSKRGSKYTRSRRPVFMAWSFEVDSRSKASKLEQRIKKLSKRDKERIIANDFDFDDVIGHIG